MAQDKVTRVAHTVQDGGSKVKDKAGELAKKASDATPDQAKEAAAKASGTVRRKPLAALIAAAAAVGVFRRLRRRRKD